MNTRRNVDLETAARAHVTKLITAPTLLSKGSFISGHKVQSQIDQSKQKENKKPSRRSAPTKG
jgi:hypothetical protein